MYTTVSIKEQWKAVFCCGNKENPEDVILILGSCRVVPYLNYLDEVNKVCGNKFKIYAIDPINYQIDSAGNKLDTPGLLKALETDEHFLSILRETTIFIHEGLSSYGILNTLSIEQTTTIYQFGIKPRLDISIPNFHDVFILFNDFQRIYFPENLVKHLDHEWLFQEGEKHIDRFCGICEKSSFPEFVPWFRNNYLQYQLFHSFNHVAKKFTLEIFRLMNEKFLKLPLDEAFWREIGKHDLYANNSTMVTELDRKWRDFQWG
jgi:hypothetical protein